ncbi:hypothetical protein CF651_03205 [Paenibacillus rigui]|uniref:Uncharacterized protein n=1 Tax=Paenibacillus rigui TaxID=554312 RepID=A0A229UY08_9BACL|nr:hypothetical protein CF651_03205 [Paenibacillus rigui]
MGFFVIDQQIHKESSNEAALLMDITRADGHIHVQDALQAVHSVSVAAEEAKLSSNFRRIS